MVSVTVLIKSTHCAVAYTLQKSFKSYTEMSSLSSFLLINGVMTYFSKKKKGKEKVFLNGYIWKVAVCNQM